MFLNKYLLILSGILISCSVSAELISPYNIESFRSKWSSSAKITAYDSCPGFITPVINFSVKSIYTDDSCRCIIDYKKKKKYDAATKTTRSFAKLVVKLADQYVTTEKPDPEIAACTLDHLNNWASAYALMGDVSGGTGYSTATNVLAPASQAFLKIKNAKNLNPKILSKVKLWLRNLARQQVIYQKYEAGDKTNNNNHRYWDAYAVVGAAIANNDEKLFLWANESLDIGLSQIIQNDQINKYGEIEPRGSLPLELARDKLSHKYHVYALSPLIGLAESIHVNRAQFNLRSPYSRFDKAIFKLIDLIITEEHNYLHSPEFVQLKGTEVLACHQTAWADMLLKRFTRISKYNNAPALAQLVADKRNTPNCNGRLYFTNLGGNTTYSFGLINLQKVIDGIQ